MPKSLGPRPNLEQLRNQARDLLNACRRGDPDAVKRMLARHGDDGRSPTRASSVETKQHRLADAQRVIAREYGFPSWPALKAHVESITNAVDPLELFRKAFADNDAAAFRHLLERFPEYRTKINEPVAAFDSPIVTCVRSRKMLDVLLEAGADINAKSRWWAGGFGLLHNADPELAAYAIERGATVDVHAAARLDRFDELRSLVTHDPALVHARGGDGQTPLHFAGSIKVAEFLLDHGADINARDIDHEATPAQHMIRDRQTIARYLVSRGCETDLLMAAALGDVDLARRHLESDPRCIQLRVSDEFFPKSNPRAGGTIYQWTLGWHVSPLDVARQFGHRNVLELLKERSPVEVRLLDACWSGDATSMNVILSQHPGLIAAMGEEHRRQIAHAARNNQTAAVRTMLKAGFPVDAVGQHRGTPLHWAAFHGNADMTREILRWNPPLEAKDADFQATPLGWAIHGSVHGWHARTGDYPSTVKLLLEAGARLPEPSREGSAAVGAVIEAHSGRR